jgi:PST family polysaccharide transporter
MKRLSDVTRNGVWLYLLQFSNLAVPFIVLPYLTRVLGPEGYGSYALALTIIGYFQVVISYGFDYSGARKAAISTSTKELSTIFSRIVVAKLSLLVLSLAVLGGMWIAFRPNGETALCSLALLPVLFGTAATQTWLYLGKSSMRYVGLITLCTRGFLLGATVWLVTSADDVIRYCLIYGCCVFVAGLAHLLCAQRVLDVRFTAPSVTGVIEEFQHGGVLFLTNILGVLLTSAGIRAPDMTAAVKSPGRG